MNKQRERARLSNGAALAPDDDAAPSWPINEVLLRNLEAQGLSDEQIAARFRIDWRQVAALRNILS